MQSGPAAQLSVLGLASSLPAREEPACEFVAAAWNYCPHICGSEPRPLVRTDACPELEPPPNRARPSSVRGDFFQPGPGPSPRRANPFLPTTVIRRAGTPALSRGRHHADPSTQIIGAGRCILPAGAGKRQIDLNRTGDQRPRHPRPNFPELRVSPTHSK